jgi:hypothetical protein
VARQDAHAWLRGDRARAPSSLDRHPEQARAGSCVGTDRTDDRRDPDHRAVASRRGAVISSAPAVALLGFVPSEHAIRLDAGFRNAMAERPSALQVR